MRRVVGASNVPLNRVAVLVTNGYGSPVFADVERHPRLQTAIDVVPFGTKFNRRIAANVLATANMRAEGLAIVACLRERETQKDRKMKLEKVGGENWESVITSFLARLASSRTKRVETPAMASSSARGARLVMSGVTGLYSTQLKCAEIVLVCTSGPSARLSKVLRRHISHFGRKIFLFAGIFSVVNVVKIKCI